MAQNDLLDTPLNDPNQEIKLAESSLKARDTSVQPATRDYFQEAMDVASGNTSAFDNAPISKAENLLRARTEKEKNFALNKTYQDIFAGTTQSQDDFLNSQGGAAELVADKDAFIQEIDNPFKYVGNVALNLGSGITDLTTGWVQAPASDMIDEEADTANLAPFLLRDKELQSLLAETTDPTEIANLSAELESITNMLDSSYNDELVAQRDAALAALNESPDSWQAKSNLSEIEWALERTPTKRQVRERAESNIDGAVATYDFLENVSEVVASKVNKAGQRKIQRQVEPYAVEASAFYENGNYAKSIGVMADGIFTVALDNPGSAIEMFANSLPQMLAMVNPFTSAPTVMAAYSKHADTMMEEFVKINGYRATGKDKEILNTGAGAAVFFDFFSDKIALKGVKVIPTNLINKITAKLGSGAPKGAKILTQYTSNIAAKTAGLAIQPVQEFVSGAGTELSEQAGVAGGFEGLDKVKIIEQGMIEAIAVSPAQAAVGIKDVVKGTKRVSTDVKESDLVKNIRESAGKALEKLEEGKLEKRSDPDSLVFKALKFSQDNAEDIQGTVEAATKYASTISTLITEALADIEANPDKTSPELLADFQKLVDIEVAITDNLTKRQETGAGLNEDDIALEIEKNLKKGIVAALSPESREKLKGSILYSMKTSDTITEEQATVLLEEGEVSQEERSIVTEYIKRVKDMQEVSSNVMDGENGVFIGVLQHVRGIEAAAASGDTITASQNLGKFTQFAEYMKVKADTFQAVWQHNRDLKAGKTPGVPSKIEIVSQDEKGRITEFKILDTAKFGFTEDSVGKVWNSTNDGQIKSLQNQVAKENKIIASYLAQVNNTVNGTSAPAVGYTFGSSNLGGRTGKALTDYSNEELEKVRENLRIRMEKNNARVKSGNIISPQAANSIKASQKSARSDILGINEYLGDDGKSVETEIPPWEIDTDQATVKPTTENKAAKPRSETPLQKRVREAAPKNLKDAEADVLKYTKAVDESQLAINNNTDNAQSAELLAKNITSKEELASANRRVARLASSIAGYNEPNVSSVEPTVSPGDYLFKTGKRAGKALKNIGNDVLETLRARLRDRARNIQNLTVRTSKEKAQYRDAIADLLAIKEYLGDDGKGSKATTSSVTTEDLGALIEPSETTTKQVKRPTKVADPVALEEATVAEEPLVSNAKTMPTILRVIEGLDGALAKANIVNRVIRVKEGLTKAEVLEYLKNSTTPTGQQKSIVTTFMDAKYGTDFLALLESMTEEEVVNFVIQHEMYHFKQHDKPVSKGVLHINNYMSDKSRSHATDSGLTTEEAKNNKYLSNTAIEMEAQANLVALRVVFNDKNIGKAPETIDPNVGNTSVGLLSAERAVLVVQNKLNSLFNEGKKNDPKYAKIIDTWNKEITELNKVVAAEQKKVDTTASVAELEVYELVNDMLKGTSIDPEHVAAVNPGAKNVQFVQNTIWQTSYDVALKLGKTITSVFQAKKEKETKSDEVIKENLNNRNLFKTVRNVFNAIKKNSAFLNMSKEELKTVNILVRFNDEFVKASAKVIKYTVDSVSETGNQAIDHNWAGEKGKEDRLVEDPINYLLKQISYTDKDGNIVNTGYLDPNILSIMAMSAYSYLSTMGTGLLWNDDAAVKQLLGLDSRTKLTNPQMAPFRRIGTTQANMADLIGSMIVKQLGLKGTGAANKNLEAQLVTSLGLHSILMLEEMGLVTRPSLPRSALDVETINYDGKGSKNINNANEESSIGTAESENTVQFVRVAVVKVGKKEIVAPKVRKMIDDYSITDAGIESSTSSVMDKLFNLESQKDFPSLIPSKTNENTRYLNTNIKIPKKVSEDLDYAQSVGWRFKPEFIELLNGDSREETIQALKDISGYKESLEDVPLYAKEAAEAVNNSILREIEDAITFFDILAEKKQDDFYYTYNSWNNSRSGMAQSAVSPQSSKIIRHLIYPTDSTTGESFQQDLDLDNAYHMQMLKVAITQALLENPKLSVDKNSFLEINKNFERVIGDGVVNKRNDIGKAGREVQKGANPFVVAAKYGLEGTLAVEGLIALGKYYKAVETGDKNVTVNISIETDATTSGLILSLLNAGLFTESALIKLRAGGLYDTDTSFIKYGKKNADNYVMLANLWAEDIKASEHNANVPEVASLINLLGYPDRDQAKDPVLQSNYGAGEAALKESYIDSAVTMLYEKLTDTDFNVRKEALALLNAVLQTDYKTMGGKNPFKVRAISEDRISEANYKSFILDTKWKPASTDAEGNAVPAGYRSYGRSPEEIKFRVMVNKVYGGALISSMSKIGNDFAGLGGQLNDVGNTVFHVWKVFQEIAEKGYRANAGIDYTTNDMQELLDNDPTLKGLQPFIKFFDTSKDSERLYGYKRDKKRTYDSGVDKVTVRLPNSARGAKSTSSGISVSLDQTPGVSLIARLIQGIDDAVMRTILGKAPVMHMFDAIFSNILNATSHAQDYNEAILAINYEYSMFDNAVLMLENSIAAFVANPAARRKFSEIVKDDSEGNVLFNTNLAAMLKSVKETQKLMNENKEVLFKEILRRSDHLGIETSAKDNILNPDVIQDPEFDLLDELFLTEDVEQFFEQNKPKPLNSSVDSDINPETFVESDSEILSGHNALDIFDTLGRGDRQGNSVDSVEHLSHLRKLLATVIAPGLNALGDFSLKMRRAGNKNVGALEDQDILLNFGVNSGSNILLNHGSERTTYVHELAHAVSRFMFDDAKLAPVANQIINLRERTRRYLDAKYKGEGWKAFMSEDEFLIGHKYDKEAELANAKATYNYIFGQEGVFWTAGNKNKASPRGIHEFVAFGLTDARLMSEMSEMPFKAERTAATTLGGRIQELFLKMVDAIIGRVKNQGKTADEALIQMVVALNRVDSKSRFNTKRLMGAMSALDGPISRKITQWVFTPMQKAMLKSSQYSGPGGLVVRNLTNVVGAALEAEVPQLPLEENGQVVMVDMPFRASLELSRKRLRISKNSLLVYILRTIAGPMNDMDRKVEHMLAISNTKIDQNRKSVIEGTKDHIEISFKTEMVKRDWEAFTKSILKTELYSLIPNLNREDFPKLMNILRNTNGVRSKRIKDIRKQLLALGTIGAHYVKQSEGLGVMMATGVTRTSMLRMNAYMIANSKGIVSDTKMPKDLVAMEALIDELATLYAVDNTAQYVNIHTADIIDREIKADPKNNGAVVFMAQAISAKKDSLERNFKNDKTHTVKGFIKSITNPNISVKVALLSEEEKMRKMGYKLVSSIPTDSISDPSKGQKALYTSDFVTLQDYNRGIISTTGMKAAGTLLSQMLTATSGESYNYVSSKLAIKNAVAANIKEYAKHVNNPDYKTTDNVMVPVFDTYQNIVDFRYMMTDHTKVNVLKQDMRANFVLSAAVGSMEDKVQTSLVNEEALRLMKADADENFLKRSDEFVKIGLKSGKAKHRELYSLLPAETRKMIVKIFGTDSIVIDEKYIDVLFGQRSLSIANLPFLNHRVVKIAEVIWKEIVSMAKKNIVIKTGSVLYHNIFSNTIVGWLNGVPIEYMIKEQLRAAKDLNDYMTTKRALFVAKSSLKTAKALNDVQGMKDAQSSIDSYWKSINNSSVRELIKRGMFQSITEEIDAESDPYSYASALSGKMDKFASKNKTLEKVYSGVKNVSRYTYMSDDTSMFKLLLKTTQYSDFVARQAVFKYKTEIEGIGKDETENLVRDLFVNYDMPDHQILQYMNETGITMFTKYPMRMLRVIYKMMKGRPVEGLMLIFLEDFINMNIDDPSDMSLNILKSPFAHLDDAFTQSGIEMGKNFLPSKD